MLWLIPLFPCPTTSLFSTTKYIRFFSHNTTFVWQSFCYRFKYKIKSYDIFFIGRLFLHFLDTICSKLFVT